MGKTVLRCKCSSMRILHLSEGVTDSAQTQKQHKRSRRRAKTDAQPSLMVTNSVSSQRKSARAFVAAARLERRFNAESRDEAHAFNCGAHRQSETPRSCSSARSSPSVTSSPKTPFETNRSPGLERLRLKTLSFDGSKVTSQAFKSRANGAESARAVASVFDRSRLALRRYQSFSSPMSVKLHSEDHLQKPPKIVFGQPWGTQSIRSSLNVLQVKAATLPRVASPPKQLPQSMSIRDSPFYSNSILKPRVRLKCR